MTEHQVVSWMKEETSRGSNYELTGLGFALSDIEEFGFEHWLTMSPVVVSECFLETTYDVSNMLMSEFRTIINQERTLDELGVGQTMKLDQAGLIEALNKGLLDVFRALNHYFLLQSEAKSMYHANEN